MIAALLLFTLGVLLSAFFSGTETGFYRITRVRLAIEALAGSWISRALLWFGNQPTVFVGTALVGNNLANYLVSLSTVIASETLLPDSGALGEVIGPIVIAPIVFLFGELLPKNLFYDAPNRLLKRCAIPLLSCAVLFAPATTLLWAFSRLVQKITRDAPPVLRLRLARRELSELLTEGHEAGILRPAQQTLAQAMFIVASKPVRSFASTEGRVVRVTTTMSKSDVLRIAQRHRRALLPVEDPHQKRRLVGYLRMMDLYLDDSPALPEPKPMVKLQGKMSCLAALRELGKTDDALGHVVDQRDKTVGFITSRELRMALLRAT